MTRIHIAYEPTDPIAMSTPVTWAMHHLQETLIHKGITSTIAPMLYDTIHADSENIIVVASPVSSLAREMLGKANIVIPAASEALAIVPGYISGQSAVLACGSDARGLVYAVLELADRVAYVPNPLDALSFQHPLVEQPATPIRGIARLFVSEVEDKPWFYDRGFWQEYLTMLATQRFNRFHLALGMGYDFVRDVVDAYFLFPYPFLVTVPGYNVRVSGLPDEERERNLSMLRFISDEATKRGLTFQLGLWMHAYAWVDSPKATYTIAGLTAENHATYCRDALRCLMEACPSITSVTFRVHGESGVAEGSYDFWRTVFEGLPRPSSGRIIELNLHPKGVNQQMLDVALATGLPVTISPKYSAEHMGLPYHQAAIRQREQAGRHVVSDRFVSQLMNLSEGALRYTRYSYADFLTHDRRYGVFYRVWPGTSRLLLWGDPALAAAYARSSTFCGCLGLELCEPLSFKGMRGSGISGSRTAYTDESLRPAYDFEKYLYTYRLFGRLLYNPHADAEQWRRYPTAEFGTGASAIEHALANASRILPLITTAHLPSAHYGWFMPEMYTNMPIVDTTIPHPFARDTDEPVRFTNVSPLDPTIFSKIEEFTDEVISGKRSGRYSPLRVAAWLETFATEALRYLTMAEATVAEPNSPPFRRLAVDVRVESELGRFFAHKLRAGVAYALYERTHEIDRLREAVEAYNNARAAWRAIIEVTRGIYCDDITFGPAAHLRGHWADRLPAIEADLAAMEAELKQAEAIRTGESGLTPLVSLDPLPPSVACWHVPPVGFRRGQPIVVELMLASDVATTHGITVRLCYRHVNQAESYHTVEMTGRGGVYRATIPGAYTDSPYALQYFFELHDSKGIAWLYPGFTASLNNQPYFVIQQEP